MMKNVVKVIVIFSLIVFGFIIAIQSSRGFDSYNGHCYITAEYQKEDEIFNKAMELYSSSVEKDCNVEFDDCYNTVKATYDSIE